MKKPIISKVNELHFEATRWVDKVLIARFYDDEQLIINCSLEALVLEAEAASLIPNGKAFEPTRSILYCSAASLAIAAKCFKEAACLAAQGLAGYPSERIKQELITIHTVASSMG